MQAIPLSAVPILIEIIGQPEHPQRDDYLATLCDLVASSYDEDGDALGSVIRESGGLLTLSWLLAEEDLDVQKRTLFLIANLASDAVDPRSYLTKRLLRQCGAEFRLLPCLDSEDEEVVAYTCGALQNLCHDPEWSQVLLDQGVVSRLEELVDYPDENVARYSAGALKNLMAALDEAGFDAEQAASIVTERTLDAVAERAKWAAVDRITQRSAAKRIQKKFLLKREAEQARLDEEDRVRELELLAAEAAETAYEEATAATKLQAIQRGKEARRDIKNKKQGAAEARIKAAEKVRMQEEEARILREAEEAVASREAEEAKREKEARREAKKSEIVRQAAYDAGIGQGLPPEMATQLADAAVKRHLKARWQAGGKLSSLTKLGLASKAGGMASMFAKPPAAAPAPAPAPAVAEAEPAPATEEENQAAAKMQAAQRGKNARKTVAKTKQERIMAPPAASSPPKNKGEKQPPLMAELESVMMAAPATAEENAAATKMQAAQRGKSARSPTKEKASPSKPSAPSAAPSPSKPSTAPAASAAMSEEDVAATKMQAIQRGKNARKQKGGKSPTKAEAPKAAEPEPAPLMEELAQIMGEPPASAPAPAPAPAPAETPAAPEPDDAEPPAAEPPAEAEPEPHPSHPQQPSQQPSNRPQPPSLPQPNLPQQPHPNRQPKRQRPPQYPRPHLRPSPHRLPSTWRRRWRRRRRQRRRRRGPSI